MKLRLITNRIQLLFHEMTTAVLRPFFGFEAGGDFWIATRPVLLRARASNKLTDNLLSTINRSLPNY